MNAQRYPEEFRIEAVKQILEHGHSVADVSRRLALEIPTTTLWPKPSTDFTKRRSSTSEGRGKQGNHWSWQRCNGCTGSTMTGCWNL